MEAQERILTKAHELFMQYGIRGVSMDEVAKDLGISKKTIYQFYQDKDALVEAVIHLETSESQNRCNLFKEKSENALQELFLSMDMMLTLLAKIHPSVIHDIEKYHPKANQKYKDFKNKYLYTTIKDNLLRGIEEGIYRENINVEILTSFRLITSFIIFNPSAFPNTQTSLPKLAAEITDHFIYGIISAKGLKLFTKYKAQRQNKQ